jgi:hypothetical protein
MLPVTTLSTMNTWEGPKAGDIIRILYEVAPGNDSQLKLTGDVVVTFSPGAVSSTLSSDEQNYQEKIKRINPAEVESFNRESKPGAYAYTWYLTSITGPDYVERDAVGSPDYGKASNGEAQQHQMLIGRKLPKLICMMYILNR